MPAIARLIIIAIVALIIVRVFSRHKTAGFAAAILSSLLILALAFALLVRPAEQQFRHHQVFQRQSAERDLLHQKIQLETALARLAEGERQLSIKLDGDEVVFDGEKLVAKSASEVGKSDRITIVNDGKRVFSFSTDAEITSDSEIQDVESIMDEFAGDECQDCELTDCDECEENDSDIAAADTGSDTAADTGSDTGADTDSETDEETKDGHATSLEQLVNRHRSDLYEFVEAETKPDWIYEEMDTSGNLHTMVVTVGPYENELQLLGNFDNDLLNGVRTYAKKHLERTGQTESAWIGPIKLHIPEKPIRKRIIDAYDGVHVPSVEGAQPMPVKYVKLGFDAAFRDKIIDLHWQQSLSLARMLQTGIVSLGVLGMIGIVFAGLKADALTRGKYPKARSLLSVFAFATLAAVAFFVLVAVKR